MISPSSPLFYFSSSPRFTEKKPLKSGRDLLSFKSSLGVLELVTFSISSSPKDGLFLKISSI